MSQASFHIIWDLRSLLWISQCLRVLGWRSGYTKKFICEHWDHFCWELHSAHWGCGGWVWPYTCLFRRLKAWVRHFALFSLVVSRGNLLLQHITSQYSQYGRRPRRPHILPSWCSFGTRNLEQLGCSLGNLNWLFDSLGKEGNLS